MRRPDYEAARESLAELRPWLPWAQAAPTLEDSEPRVRKGMANFLLRRGCAVAERAGLRLEATRRYGTATPLSTGARETRASARSSATVCPRRERVARGAILAHGALPESAPLLVAPCAKRATPRPACDAPVAAGTMRG